MNTVFELIKTFEFEIEVKEEVIRGRITLFRDLKDREFFKVVTSEAELFRVQPSFPQDKNGVPEHTTDEVIWVDRSLPGKSLAREGFRAASLSDAIRLVIQEIQSFQKHFDI